MSSSSCRMNAASCPSARKTANFVVQVSRGLTASPTWNPAIEESVRIVFDREVDASTMMLLPSAAAAADMNGTGTMTRNF